MRLWLRRGRHPAALDRRGRGPGLRPIPRLALGALAFGLGAGLTLAPGLTGLKWLAPGHDVVVALGFQPPECLTPAGDPETAWKIEVGRAAFRSPLILGGQAARARISCESCHRNGRTNPDFLFQGVSGPPGTADVTSSLFSSHRGNGIDDPRPIPDLGGPKARLRIDQAPDQRALEPFIHGLVTEEFDGPEPPPAVLAGLAAYVRALGPAACPSPAAPRPLHAADYLEDARRAFTAALGAMDRSDLETALVLIGAGQTRLGAVSERYDRSPALQIALGKLSGSLFKTSESLRTGRLAAARADLVRRIAQLKALGPRLAAEEPKSLFDPARLADAARLPRGS